MLKPFDSSEADTVHSLKVFSTKVMLPNIFNNLISVDPVVTKVTKDFLENEELGGGYYRKKMRERDEVRYNLEEQEEVRHSQTNGKTEGEKSHTSVSTSAEKEEDTWAEEDKHKHESVVGGKKIYA